MPAAKIGNLVDQSRSLRSWSIYRVERETNCVYAFVLAYLELASAENQSPLRPFAKEMWTFCRRFFALPK